MSEATSATDRSLEETVELAREGIQSEGSQGLARARPIVDPGCVSTADMLRQPPPEEQWLLDGLLPLGVVGTLAAAGGSGKSTLLLQLAIAVCTGRGWLGFRVRSPGGVLLISAEDERWRVHQRLSRMIGELQQSATFRDKDMNRLASRLFVAPRVGADNRLIAEADRQILRTGRAEQITALVEQLPEPVSLIILDPASRFRDGNENDNQTATRFVEALESLREMTGATVLAPHHVAKAGGAEGELTPAMLRGASALVDGFRWAGAMATLRKEQARKRYGIDPAQAHKYVRLDVVKNNYAPPWSGTWLYRLPSGALAPVRVEQQREKSKAEHNEQCYRDVLSALKELLSERRCEGRPLTRRKLRDYAGVAGVLGVGDKKLRAIVERALAEGEIRAVPAADGQGEILEPC